MYYKNPVMKGMYPDPSVCRVGDSYYMVNSTFQFFPGVPISESKDLVHWKQIGNCFTRASQVELENVNTSGGVFAATIRYNNGRFYVVTNNNTYQKNFYVWTDDICGEWSEPLFVEQGGIDPSLLFEDDKCYFTSNGWDEQKGCGAVYQCEIDIETGKKLTESKLLWYGTGGRYLEGPHLYKINGWYYLLAAEGGTEYGHMITYARSKNPYGPFESYCNNPVLTNRNLGGYEVQGIGHGELVEDTDGNWWMIHLGFRQQDEWMPYHHLGRETYLAPVMWTDDGWFKAGDNGTTRRDFTIPGIADVKPQGNITESFSNTNPKVDWLYIRKPHTEDYQWSTDALKVRGTRVKLDDYASPTFVGLRQKDFNACISVDVNVLSDIAGVTLYMDEREHYDLYIDSSYRQMKAVLRLRIGDAVSIVSESAIASKSSRLFIEADAKQYHFSVFNGEKNVSMGSAATKYLSSEVAAGFTGVLVGLFAEQTEELQEDSFFTAEFTNFECIYSE